MRSFANTRCLEEEGGHFLPASICWKWSESHAPALGNSPRDGVQSVHALRPMIVAGGKIASQVFSACL